MCGRFSLNGDYQSMMDAFRVTSEPDLGFHWDSIMPRYNVAPTDYIPVIFQKLGQKRALPMRWGLMPSHTANVRGRAVFDGQENPIITPINARSETVHSNGSFKWSFGERRCLIPASGFYEWKEIGGVKIPFWIHLKNRPWMAFAGVYSWWKSPNGKLVPSCAIITTVANKFMEPIHDRMPVILTESAYGFWLDPENQARPELRGMLVPYSNENMGGHSVSRRINKPDNEDPELIKPSTEQICLDNLMPKLL